MVQDTLGMDDDEIEVEADEEVDKVLMELTAGVLQGAGQVATDLPATEEPAEPALEEPEDDMEARLEALKS